MVVLPRGLLQNNAGSNALKEGALVTYDDEGQLVLAVVLRPTKKKWAILGANGKEKELGASRLHLLPNEMPGRFDSRDERKSYLKGVLNRAEKRVSEVDARKLWKETCQEVRPYTNSELAKKVFGKDEIQTHLAVRIAIVSSGVYFKRKKDMFVPRTEENVQELVKAQAVKQEQEKLLVLTEQYFTAVKDNPKAKAPEEIRSNIELLRKTAGGRAKFDNKTNRVVHDILGVGMKQFKLPKTGRREELAFNLLKCIGEVDSFTNLVFDRHEPPVEFSKEAQKQGKGLLQKTTEFHEREDLSGIECATIDDAYTTDMDDAVSLVKTGEGYQLGIHITDVSELIERESALDKEALLRGTSIYLPEATLHMFPTELSANLLSLKSQKVRPCISLICELDSALNIQSTRLARTFIKVSRKLSYPEVDQLLTHEDPEMLLLYNVANNFEASRIASGGFRVNKRDAIAAPDRKGGVTVTEVDESAPARSMVGELMVLMNHEIAKFCDKNNIPVPYRTQEPAEYDPDKNPDLVPEGPARDFATRIGLKRSVVSFSPGFHATLGLDSYTQATSPIRRYFDLVIQRQLNAFMLGNLLPYSQADLEKLHEVLGEPLARAATMTKESKRFWALKYLELQRDAGVETITGVVIRTDMRHPMVELDEVYIPALLRTDKQVSPGDEITMQIRSVKPQFDELRLEY